MEQSNHLVLETEKTVQITEDCKVIFNLQNSLPLRVYHF